ncbi:MAG: hypothetical protein LBR56_08770 [Sporomusaceae bacterium]|jgi:Na+-transporting methylmalonyl-CoA/oxaloacetate decarboxylase gamma subunit|nr:hypothetical protein [Sporomusaceae bacterium]
MSSESTGSLLATITRLIENNADDSAGLDNLVTVLSLFCLLCVFTRGQGAIIRPPAPQSAKDANALNKLLGDLMKGGAPSSAAAGTASAPSGQDTLMSLLPLLNNPHLKAKLNPATIANVFSLINSMGSFSDKQDASKEKPKEETKETVKEPVKEERQEPFDEISAAEEQEGKSLGRYLHWKTNF